MKTLLPIFCLVLLIAHSAPAQIVDRSLGFNFAYPSRISPIGNDRWLAVGIAYPYDGALFKDSVFALIFDQQGHLLLKKALILPVAEAYDINAALPLADGAFLVSVTSGDCDAGGYARYVRKYDADGTLIWSLQGSIFTGIKPPAAWRVAPDGNLLGISSGEVWKVDASTGSVLWKAQVALSYYFELLPGTEDFLSVGFPDFQIWEKVDNPPNDPIYVAQNSLELADYRSGLGFAPNGWYYAQNRVTYELERVNANLDREVLGAFRDLRGLKKMSAGGDGLYFLGRQDGENWLNKTDFLGQNPIELPKPDRWLNSYLLAARGDSVAIFGIDGSGPKSTFWAIISDPVFQVAQPWLRTFSGSAFPPSTDTTNAVVTGLQQLSAVDTMSFGGNFNHYYSLHGGNFQVQLTNQGNTLLEQVYVNFAYELNQNSICYFQPTAHQLYTGLGLAPGTSIWLNFGDLNVSAQSSLASEFCFWTSAPNGRPDARHEDDHYCTPATYTVPTTTPSGLLIQLLPNPAQDYFRVLNAADAQGTTWQLHDATGRLVQEGIYPAGQPELSVSTQHLPNGFYFFRMNNYRGKLMVRH